MKEVLGMLYPRNKDKELSLALFKNPTSEYRGTPFWSWNCALEEEELLWQIDTLREMGFGGFHMHTRNGMKTEYLGEKFMDLVASCVNKAKRDNMLAWLYDEDRWPSGFAGGLVTKELKYRKRILLMTVHPFNGESEDGVYLTYSVKSQTKGKAPMENTDPSQRYDVVLNRDGTLKSYKTVVNGEELQVKRVAFKCNTVLLGRFEVVLNVDGTLKSYRTLADGEDAAEGTVWYAYLFSGLDTPRYNDQAYVNTLDKKAIERFIETTHEVYKKKVGHEFGGVIPAMFTDEPQYEHKGSLKFATSHDDVTLPWADDLDETYRAAYGDTLVDKIPELFWELPDGKVSVARYRYHDHTAERFASAFSDTLGNWCAANGIALTGHMMREPSLLSQTHRVGEAMRHYRRFGIPGIDMLEANHEYTTAKQAQSAVNQYGREAMLDELYGVTSWDFDFRGHKLYGDWQAALGVTVRVPHLAWVSMEGEAKRDYPAAIGYQSPWYKEYSYIEDHFARVNTAMTRGKPVVKVGVIHPIESYWLHFGPSDQTAMARGALDQTFKDTIEWLLFGSIDFDYISEALLPELCEQGSAPLKVGAMAYDAVVVPACETLRSTTLQRLEAFRAAGGKLIFMGDAPKYVDAIPSDAPAKLYAASQKIAISRSALIDALQAHRTVEIRSSSGALSDDYFYRMREEEDGKRWIFIGRGKDPKNVDIAEVFARIIKVFGKYAVTLYDTIDGEVKPIAYKHDAEGNTVISAKLYQDDSLLLLLTPTDAAPVALPAAPKTESKAIRAPYAVPFKLDEPNAMILDLAEWAIDDEDFNPLEEILRIDTAVRTRYGWTPWSGGSTQPWLLPKDPPNHTLRLRYVIESEIAYEGALLALENPEVASLKLNGEMVDSTKPVGYYVDKSIKTVKLPTIKAGINVLEADIPYGESVAAEAMFLLGAFGVRVEGYHSVVTALPKKLAFGDIVPQGLPFYSGKLTYCLEAETNGGKLKVRAPQYRASLLRMNVDGQSKIAAFSPYTAEFDVAAGKHNVEIVAYIPRTNGFAPLHDADDGANKSSPGRWRTKGDSWSYEYRLAREGVLVSPELSEITVIEN